MKRWFSVVLFVMSLFACMTPELLAQDSAEPKKPDDKPAAESAGLIRGYYAIIARQAKLTAAQRAEMEKVLAARAEALKAFDDANGAKIKELSEALAKASEANDDAKASELRRQRRRLNASRRKIEDQQRENVLAILTPEQKKIVQGYNLYIGAVQRFRNAELTDDQKKQVRALAADAGKKVTEETDNKTLGKIKDELSEQVVTKVLTDEQRDKVTKKGDESPKTAEPKKADQ